MLLGVLVCFAGARTFVRNYDWQSASTLFDSALHVVPGSAKVQLNVGIERWREGKLQLASRHLSTAERIDPEYCQVHYWFARVHLDAKDYHRATARFQQALSCKELDHHKYAQEALEKIYKEMIRVHPKTKRGAFGNLANIYMLQGRVSEAVEYYTLALQHDSNNKHNYANFAYCRLQQGRAREALQLASQALQMDPSFRAARDHAAAAQAMLAQAQGSGQA